MGEATVTRVADKYYVLTFADKPGREVGGTIQAGLVQFARIEGYTVRKVDGRTPALRAKVFDERTESRPQPDPFPVVLGGVVKVTPCIPL